VSAPPPAERIVEARTHGRYLVRDPPHGGPWPLLIGFHGYAETAEVHLEALGRIAGADGWLIVAAQALHPFYTRDQRVVASWMTRQDRELAIADNVDYVLRVVDAVRAEFRTRAPLVCAGFSQGGAMAYRSAARLGADAVLVLAADVPPDVAAAPARLGRVLIGRGTRDPWYTPEKHAADLAALAASPAVVESCIFDGAHEWSETFHAAAGRLLAELESSV
jgi:poly(3-hydroxybutyrate) depolymerase